jgi:hypothetical protein
MTCVNYLFNGFLAMFASPYFWSPEPEQFQHIGCAKMMKICHRYNDGLWVNFVLREIITGK